MTLTANVCHPECAPNDVEEYARDIVARVLHDDELLRVCARESSRQKPDFRSPRHSVEVKELVSPDLRSVREAQKRHIGDYEEVDTLRETWGVCADASLAFSSFEPTTATPKVKPLIRKLTPLLVRLEANGATDARSDPEIWPFVASLLHGGWCSVIPKSPYPPGILLIGPGYGYERTTDIETDVVAPLQDWLSSKYADNVRQSLGGENGVRCAVLVASMDGPAFAMIRTLAETQALCLGQP
jgi:hypothetical protein